jgi:hypothetical protein
MLCLFMEFMVRRADNFLNKLASIRSGKAKKRGKFKTCNSGQTEHIPLNPYSILTFQTPLNFVELGQI